jgi:hypothetical protein
MNLSEEGLQFLLDQEVGGGEFYYNRFLKHPTWPGAFSGVTIGIGFDLGQVKKEEFADAWAEHLRPEDFKSLLKCIGLKGIVQAKPALKEIAGIQIGWDEAMAVFREYTLPVHWLRLLRIYPQAETLPPLCAAALLSLCFNRGTDLLGDRRLEMREIQSFLSQGELSSIPQQFRNMERLWPTVPGLRKRRHAEANLFEKGLSNGSIKVV